MTSSSDNIMFVLGDTVKVCLNSATIEGVLAREDSLGITLRDLADIHLFRFVPWECILIIEYAK